MVYLDKKAEQLAVMSAGVFSPMHLLLFQKPLEKKDSKTATK